MFSFGVRLNVVALAVVLLLPSALLAQQASGIAGAVRDTSGGVLPGVTVEVSSPVLIEGARTVYTDAEGRYNMVDLRPGTYTVTFTLPGFSTFRREGIQLTAGFTANVNADMPVGTVQETITVTGAAPLVDTRRTQQQTVASSALLDALPTGMKALNSVLVLAPGLSGVAAGVGSSQGVYRSTSVNASYHGKRQGGRISFDGMNVTNTNSGDGAAGYIINGAHVEEVVLEAGGVMPEMAVAGFNVNFLPKDGGNTFRGTVSGTYANHDMQASNLDDKLRARGLTTESTVEDLYDFVTTVGGPIQRDRLWFFAAHRQTGTANQLAGAFWNKTQGTLVYTPDLDRPANREDRFWSQAGRFTWQPSARNRLNVFADYQHNIVRGSSNQITDAPEAIVGWDFKPQGLYQVSWTSPRTSQLLLEAGASWAVSAWPQFPLGAARLEDISILEQSTNFRYNSGVNYNTSNDAHRWAQRASVAYVTGSHSFKAGVTLEQGRNSLDFIVDRKHDFFGGIIDGNVSYTFLNGRPVSLTQYASPLSERNNMDEVSVFAQDSWTLGRLTLNYGARYEYFNGSVPAQHLPANPWMPARSFEAVRDVPRWHDINPRVGAVYDLFGNGRTALKASLGRYSAKMGVVVPRANNPVVSTVNTVSRAWNDVNGNFIPDCNLANRLANGECQQVSNLSFGQTVIRSRYDERLLRGWHVREYLWDGALEVQHQLTSDVSVNIGYYPNWYGNLHRTPVIDNQLVTPADYDPFCVTAPVDSRLPGGGGYQVCGLYDIKPEKFGLVDEVITTADLLGEKQSRVNNFISANVNTRFAGGANLGGGLSTGRTVEDRCFVVDSPQELLNCRVEWPWMAQTQLKLFGSYPLPGDFVVSGILRNEAGLRTGAGGQSLSIEANWAVPNAQVVPSLGRNLAGGARSVTVPLVAPYTMFDPRLTQLDLRLTKNFRLWASSRLQANLDLYNALNANPVVGTTNAYGPRWQRPTQILEGRLIQVSGQLTF